MNRRKAAVRLTVWVREERYRDGLPALKQPLKHVEQTKQRGKEFSSNDAGDGPEEIVLSDGSGEEEKTQVKEARAELKCWASNGTTSVSDALASFEGNDVVTKRFGNELKKYHILQLTPKSWLDGKTINFYMYILQSRSNKQFNRNERRGRVVFLEVDFFEKLMAEKYEYNEAKKHTRELKIAETDTIIAPVNVNGNHWILLEVKLSKKKMTFYDSLNTDIRRYLKAAEK